MENSASFKNTASTGNRSRNVMQDINYALYDIANAVNTSHTLKHLYQSIHHSLNKLLGLPNFFIARYDEQTRMITFEYFIDEYDEGFPIIESGTTPNSLTGEVIQAKRPLLIKENLLKDRAQNNRLVGTLPKIWLGVPLIVQDRTVGVISIQHYTNPDQFSHQHLELLVCVSELLAMAIERIQILEKLEKEKEIRHLIADHTDSVIFMINSTGIYNFVNPSHIKLGYHPDEIINTSFFNLVHPENLPEILEFIEKGIQGRVFQDSFTFGIQDKSGEYHGISGILNMIRSNEAGLENIIFVGRLIQKTKNATSREIPGTFTKKKSAVFEDAINLQRPKTVLIIEDDESVRGTTARALKMFGYNPIEAPDGESGLDIYKISYHSIDAVFLDIILPGISGMDTYKSILKTNPHAKILITSGHVTGSDQQRLFSNAAAFMEKPYEIMMVRETLNKIFNAQNQDTGTNPIHLIPF